MSSSGKLLSSNRRSYFKLLYDLILPFEEGITVSDEVKAVLAHVFEEQCARSETSFVKERFEDGYVVFSFYARSNTDLTKFVNAYKTASSRHARKSSVPDGRSFWGASYCLISRDVDTKKTEAEFIKKYQDGLKSSKEKEE